MYVLCDSYYPTIQTILASMFISDKTILYYILQWKRQITEVAKVGFKVFWIYICFFKPKKAKK